MGRELLRWFVHDIFFGMIPLLVHILVSIIISQDISVILFCSEMLFLNIEILISVRRIIAVLQWTRWNEEVLAFTEEIDNILLIFFSILYGCIFIIEYAGISVNDVAVYIITFIMTCISISIGVGTNYIKVTEERD